MTEVPAEAAIEAEVRLLSTEDGGRRHPIASGYRCNCSIGNTIGGRPVDNDATFYLDVDSLSPGRAAHGWVRPHLPEEWRHIAPGTVITMREGARTVGHAVVIAARSGE